MNFLISHEKQFKKYSNLFVIFLLILVPAIVASPLLYRFLPRSDGPAHFFKIWLLRYELDNYGKVFDWNPFWYGGHPLFRFYPPMSYWITAALSYVVPLQLYQVFNLMIFISYILLSFSTYYLSRILKFSKISSLTISIIVIVSPTLASFYSFVGVFPSIIAFSFVPLALAFLIKTFDEGEIRYFILTALLLSIIILTHHITAYFTIMLFILIFIFKTLQFGYKKFKTTLIYSLIILGISFLLTSFWTVPLILESQYSNFINTFALNPFKILFTPLSKGCIEFYCLRSLGPEFVIFGLLGIVLSFFHFSIKNGDFSFKFRFEKNYIFISLIFLLNLLLLIIPFLGFNKLAFGIDISNERFVLYLILSIALLCGVVIEKLRRYPKFLIIVSVIFLIIFSHYGYISYTRNYELLSDSSTVSYSENAKVLYDFIRSQDEGRMEIYGTFRPLASSVIPILTQRQVITGWYHESDLTYDTILSKIEEPDLGNAEFLDKISEEEYFEILDEGFVRYILINLCSVEGEKVKTVLSKKFNVIYSYDECFKILENNKTYFTVPDLEWKRISPEEIIIYNVPETALLVKESYYPHWHAYCGNKEFSTQPDKYGMITVSSENCAKLYLRYQYPISYNLLYFIPLLTLLIVVVRLLKSE